VPPAVFFISGLVLRTDDLRIALKYKLGVAWGFLSTLGITPCLGFAFRAVPLSPSAFAAGIG
jgi:sodium/bile acid cotransporter 7